MPASDASQPPARVRIGTQGWNYADWVGPFYPAGTRAPEMLATYGRAFGTVEVDSTFYAVPPLHVVRAWAARTPDGFAFALKLPREATHERRLVDVDDVMAAFLPAARALGEKLGPVLIQLGPDFAPREMPALARFVRRLPADVRWAVEVRQAGWMAAGVLPDLLSLLAEHGVALALSDGRWVPRSVVLGLVARPTADFHYLRWMGPNRDLTVFSRVQVDRTDELSSWAHAIRAVSQRGVDVWGYVNNHFSGHSPASARQLQRMLGEPAVEPAALGEQISLF